MTAERLAHANDLIQLIANHGRKFFNSNGHMAKMHLDSRGRVWFQDARTGKLIYTHYSGKWKAFSHGGTLRSLVERLRDYVNKGVQLPPSIICPERCNVDDGNIWGYEESEAKKLRAACQGLPIFRD